MSVCVVLTPFSKKQGYLFMNKLLTIMPQQVYQGYSILINLHYIHKVPEVPDIILLRCGPMMIRNPDQMQMKTVL